MPPPLGLGTVVILEKQQELRKSSHAFFLGPPHTVQQSPSTLPLRWDLGKLTTNINALHNFHRYQALSIKLNSNFYPSETAPRTSVFQAVGEKSHLSSG